jgi:hypothetical protein
MIVVTVVKTTKIAMNRTVAPHTGTWALRATRTDVAVLWTTRYLDAAVTALRAMPAEE